MSPLQYNRTLRHLLTVLFSFGSNPGDITSRCACSQMLGKGSVGRHHPVDLKILQQVFPLYEARESVVLMMPM
jgi:hypothetical protein